MQRSLITLITPNFNKSQFIIETLNSVLNQTDQNWELLIIDDLSTDNSKEIIQDYVKLDDRIQLIANNKNQGANVCRNQGLNMAKGEFILFLDADDVLAPTCLEKRLKMITKDTDAVVFKKYKIHTQVHDSELCSSPRYPR